MKRKRFYLLLMTIVTGFLIASPVMAIPTAYLQMLDTPTAVGDLFDVEVWADRDGIGLDLLAFGFDITFDNGGVFSYDGYQLGPGWNDDSFGPNNIAGSAFPGIGEDDILLATLSFSILSIGSDTLNTIGVYDGMFSGLYYELPDFSLEGYDIVATLDITVEGTTPVPEPSTMLLLSLGLVGLAGINRKKFFKKS